MGNIIYNVFQEKTVEIVFVKILSNFD